MTAPKAPERPRTGLPALRAKVKLRGLQAIDKQTAAAQHLLNWRRELIDALGPFLRKHRLPIPEIRRLPEDNVREGFFTRAEVDALVAALPEDLRDFVRWGYL